MVSSSSTSMGPEKGPVTGKNISSATLWVLALKEVLGIQVCFGIRPDRLVHGDDYVCSGDSLELKWLAEMLNISIW